MISDKIKDGFFNFKDTNLYNSSFNTIWFKELGITPRVIFDIGSYDFGDSIRFKNEFPDSSVFAFEADPERYAISEKYAREAEVFVENLALYKKNGEIEFYPSSTNKEDYSSQGSIYKHTDLCKDIHPYINQKPSIKVKCNTLETYCTMKCITSIDLAHIDVEGAEMDVIIGMGKIRPRILYIETQRNFFIGASSVDETHEKLQTMGYKLLLDAISDRLYILN
jgi:FkbM family methyltransferase